jgi:hypothetical protein
VPADAQPPLAYRGPTRLIVPTVRTSFTPGETLTLRALILSEQPVAKATLHWRKMGQGRFTQVPLQRVDRGVYAAPLGGVSEDIEYYVRAEPARGPAVVFPAAAPRLCQTLVALPAR